MPIPEQTPVPRPERPLPTLLIRGLPLPPEPDQDAETWGYMMDLVIDDMPGATVLEAWANVHQFLLVAVEVAKQEMTIAAQSAPVPVLPGNGVRH